MLKESDIEIGTRVICNHSSFYNKTGVIVHLDFDAFGGLTWQVEDEEGNRIGDDWSHLAYFDLSRKTVNSRAMGGSDMQVGTKVICMYSDYYNQIGYIDSINWASIGVMRTYDVKKANGNRLGSPAGWAKYSSFNVVIEDETVPELPDEIFKKIVLTEPTEEKVEITHQSDKPCPAYYYGIKHCICGKCTKSYL